MVGFARLFFFVVFCEFLSGAPHQGSKPDPKVQYETMLKATMNSARDMHLKIAKKLGGKKAFKWSINEYKKALKIDPDHSEARRKLGYSKRGIEWVKDPSIKVELANDLEMDSEELYRDYLSSLDKEGQKVSKKFMELYKFCERNELANEAKKALEMAVVYYPDNAEARGLLKHVKFHGGWAAEKTAELRKKFEKWDDPSNSEGDPATSAGKFETGLGYAMAKRQTSRFFIESTLLDDETLKGCVRIAEHVYKLFNETFGYQVPPIQKQINICILSAKDQHSLCIDKFFSHDDPRIKELAKGANGMVSKNPPFAEMWYGTANKTSIDDQIVHNITEILFWWAARGGTPPWFSEALAFYFTINIKGTLLTKCIEWKGTGSLRGRKLDNIRDWPHVLREWVRTGEDPLIDTVVKSSLAQLTPEKTIKAWSIVDFLLTEYPDRMKELFLEFGADERRGALQSGIPAIKKVLGLTLDELDERWRHYVMKTY